jgi:hypothetical protein
MLVEREARNSSVTIQYAILCSERATFFDLHLGESVGSYLAICNLFVLANRVFL